MATATKSGSRRRPVKAAARPQPAPQMGPTEAYEKGFNDAKAELKPAQPNRKIAIVGFARSSMMLAPFNDPSWEIWGVNEIYTELPRIDHLFEIHDYERLQSKERNPQHLQWMQKAKIPIWMKQHFEDIPNSRPFPFAQVEKWFDGTYFTNTISWMIGLALAEGPAQLGVWGVDMAADEEYGLQRPSCEFLLGFGQAMVKFGMLERLIIPKECDLLKVAFQYGRETRNHQQFVKRLRARKSELKGQAGNHENQAQQQRDMMNQAFGAMTAITQMEKQYLAEFDPSNERKRDG